MAFRSLNSDGISVSHNPTPGTLKQMVTNATNIVRRTFFFFIATSHEMVSGGSYIPELCETNTTMHWNFLNKRKIGSDRNDSFACLANIWFPYWAQPVFRLIKIFNFVGI